VANRRRRGDSAQLRAFQAGLIGVRQTGSRIGNKSDAQHPGVLCNSKDVGDQLAAHAQIATLADPAELAPEIPDALEARPRVSSRNS
jgi:hypothetical protein